VFGWIAGRSNAEYPTAYRAEIEEIVAQWWPLVAQRATETA